MPNYLVFYMDKLQSPNPIFKAEYENDVVNWADDSPVSHQELEVLVQGVYIPLEEFLREATKTRGVINHPSHYTAYKGIEVIDLTEQMNFNRGNAVKYIARAGLKDPDKEVEDLEKAVWYIKREIQRLKTL